MSKERARRRAEREAERARAMAERARREERVRRRRELRARVRGALPRRVRVARQRGLLARRRRSQNAVAVVLFLFVQVAGWFLLDGWAARIALFLFSLLLLPVFVTLAFDRRS
ncbi:hypothetical protein [Bailinhaonella thermotolerans]|uniref:Uncharacterized protein n=1 Tax=Bailinhaonella thermotolerans TaxID=1070861 RepID=A0A3A4ARG0_9ACTN|nr:hypothetical protein [Bailinhaonella thermotolerans]RJL31199.1 hypothetical protein D5H75_19210 [Bailinhaonella thermotolerans]